MPPTPAGGQAAAHLVVSLRSSVVPSVPYWSSSYSWPWAALGVSQKGSSWQLPQMQGTWLTSYSPVPSVEKNLCSCAEPSGRATVACAKPAKR